MVYDKNLKCLTEQKPMQALYQRKIYVDNTNNTKFNTPWKKVAEYKSIIAAKRQIDEFSKKRPRKDRWDYKIIPVHK